MDFAAKHGYLRINWRMILVLFKTALPAIDQVDNSSPDINSPDCVSWKATVLRHTDYCLCVDSCISPYDISYIQCPSVIDMVCVF